MELPRTQTSVFKDAENFAYNQAIMATLGHPQNTHPAIHVAGTSGKGTICYLIESLLRAHGKRTGLMVSPHVYDIRERIQINGEFVSEDIFTRNLNAVLEKVAPELPSYFEILASLGFFTTAQSALDYLVVEVGFGGLWDTTNTITRPDKVCVLSQIGYDHTAILGKTLTEIAAQKAGIIQKNSTVVALRQDPIVNQVFEAAAEEKNASIIWVEHSDDYQINNRKLALAAARVVCSRDGWELDETLSKETLARTTIPGRFERIEYQNTVVILDGAHNTQKLAALAGRLKKEQLYPVTFVLSMGKRDDVVECLEILKPVAARVIACQYQKAEQDVPKPPFSSARLAEYCEKLSIPVVVAADPKDALARAAEFSEPVVATGSFFLLGEVKRQFIKLRRTHERTGFFITRPRW